MVNLQKGLVGHWTMDDDDTSGGTLYDRSAYDNHGTNNGASVTSGLGQSAYDFGGSDHIILPDLSSDGSFTATAWVNLDDHTGSKGNNATLGPHVYGGGNGFRIWIDLDDGYLGIWTGDNGNIVNTKSSFYMPLNEWVHVTATSNGSTVKVYGNGTEVASNTTTVSPFSGESVIGKYTESDSYYIDGQQQDVRIYDRALSQSEISALYNMRSQRQITPFPRVYYYNTQNLYNSNGHASNASELDNFYDPSRSDVSLIHGGVHERDTIYHGDGGQSSTFGSVNSTPNYFTRFDGYSWKVEGTFVAEETGTYSFGIDGDDAMDVFIDGKNVASWYGGHGFNGDVANHSGTISLTDGTAYDFRFRYEEGGVGSGGAVGWQRPSDSSWKIFPANKLV